MMAYLIFVDFGFIFFFYKKRVPKLGPSIYNFQITLSPTYTTQKAISIYSIQNMDKARCAAHRPNYLVIRNTDKSQSVSSNSDL